MARYHCSIRRAGSLTRREVVLSLLRQAGAENDERAFVRLLVENPVSRASARRAFEDGRRWAAARRQAGKASMQSQVMDVEVGPSLGLRYRHAVRSEAGRNGPLGEHLLALSVSELGAVIGHARSEGEAMLLASNWCADRHQETLERVKAARS